MNQWGKKIWAGWKRIANRIGRWQTRVFLAIFYFLIFAPLGAVMRLLGWDPLGNRDWRNDLQTNWQQVKESEVTVESLKRQS